MDLNRVALSFEYPMVLNVSTHPASRKSTPEKRQMPFEVEIRICMKKNHGSKIIVSALIFYIVTM